MMVLTGFITACTNDETVDNNKNNQDEETVEGTTFIGGIDTKSESATRTSLEMTYPGGSAAKLFLGTRRRNLGQKTEQKEKLKSQLRLPELS